MSSVKPIHRISVSGVLDRFILTNKIDIFIQQHYLIMKAIRLIKKAVKWYLDRTANSYIYPTGTLPIIKE